MLFVLGAVIVCVADVCVGCCVCLSGCLCLVLSLYAIGVITVVVCCWCV